MTVFKVSGTFLMKNRQQKFTKELIAENKDRAEEYILSDLGSRHKVCRSAIKIQEIKKVQDNDIADKIIQKQVTRGE